jgi:F-type H+-transporting ATPase subunit b
MALRIVTTVLAVLLVSASASAAQTEQAREQGLFSGSFADAVWTVAAFVAVLVILSKVAWKPMVERLNARERHIQQQIDAANNARQQAEKLLDEYKQQGTRIIKDAADQAQQRQEELLHRARREVLAIKQKTQDDIEYARSAALEQLWAEAAGMISALSREVLGRTVSAEDNHRLTQDAIGQMKTNTTTDSHRLSKT